MRVIGFTIVLVGLIGGFFTYRSLTEPNGQMLPATQDPTSQSETLNENPLTPLPYSIDDLANRKFPEGTIVIEDTVRETAAFTSYKVAYLSDDLKLFALMNVPKGQIPPEGFPVVIVNHGYIPPDEYSTENSYINTSAFYASQGFLVLKPDYRGHDNSQGDTDSVFSRIAYAVDVIHLIKALPSIPQADDRNVFLYGHSMGGDVSMRVMATTSLVKGASLWAPAVTDYPESQFYFARRNGDSERLKRLTEELSAAVLPERYDDFSVTAHADKIQVPVMIHHGSADESVPVSWGRDLFALLQRAGKQVAYHEYPGDNHDIGGNFGRALNRDVEFFRSLIRQ